MRVRLLFAWYDLWVGAYWDRAHRRLYLLPVPMLGIVLDFGVQETEVDRIWKERLRLHAAMIERWNKRIE